MYTIQFFMWCCIRHRKNYTLYHVTTHARLQARCQWCCKRQRWVLLQWWHVQWTSLCENNVAWMVTQCDLVFVTSHCNVAWKIELHCVSHLMCSILVFSKKYKLILLFLMLQSLLAILQCELMVSQYWGTSTLCWV